MSFVTDGIRIRCLTDDVLIQVPHRTFPRLRIRFRVEQEVPVVPVGHPVGLESTLHVK